MAWEQLQQILTTIGAPALISFLFTTCINRRNAKKDKKEDIETELQRKVRENQEHAEERFDTIEQHLEEHEKKAEELDKEILRQLQEKEDLLKAVDAVMLISNNALQALLRDRIIQAYNFNLEREYMPTHEKESLDSMFTEYRKLGGNGVIQELVERLHSLPTEPPKK